MDTSSYSAGNTNEDSEMQHLTKPPAPVNYGLPIALTLFACQGAILFGWQVSFSSPCGTDVKNDAGLSQSQSDLMWSILSLGAMFGSLLAGKIADMLGRRMAILIGASFFTVGAVLMTFWVTYAGLIIGRFVSGFGVGYSSVMVPLYIGEIAPTNLRGLLGACNQLFIAFGCFLVNVVGLPTVTHHEFWKVMMMLNLVFVGVQFFGILLWSPETPRWLLSQDRRDDARNSLRRLRGPLADIDGELESMIKKDPNTPITMHSPLLDDSAVNAEVVSIAPSTPSTTTGQQTMWQAMLEPSSMRPFAVGILLMLLQQWCGINAFVFNTKALFVGNVPDGTELDESQSHDALVGAIIVNAVQVIFTLFSVFLMDRVGRRFLLLLSAGGEVIVCIVMGIVYYYDAAEAVKITVVLVYYALFALGLGPVPWTVCGEIFPSKTSSLMISLCTVINWSSAFVVTLTFNTMQSSLTTPVTFWFYGGVCAVGTVLVYLFVPETKNRSLEEIQRNFSRGFMQ